MRIAFCGLGAMGGSFAPADNRLALARKDLDLILEEARRVGVRMEIDGAARARLAAAEGAGMGDLDFTSVIAHVRDSAPRSA